MTDVASAVCRALAHPVRRALLSGLLTGECDVGNMTGNTRLDQPTVSKHLAILRQTGLVVVRVDGRRRCYSLAHREVVEPLLALLDSLQERSDAEGAPTSALNSHAR